MITQLDTKSVYTFMDSLVSIRDYIQRAKEMARHRYKIEAKNAELKQRHGFDVARASGLFSMELQAATTIFVVNMKRIMTLINTK